MSTIEIQRHIRRPRMREDADTLALRANRNGGTLIHTSRFPNQTITRELGTGAAFETGKSGGAKHKPVEITKGGYLVETIEQEGLGVQRTLYQSRDGENRLEDNYLRSISKDPNLVIAAGELRAATMQLLPHGESTKVVPTKRFGYHPMRLWMVNHAGTITEEQADPTGDSHLTTVSKRMIRTRTYGPSPAQRSERYDANLAMGTVAYEASMDIEANHGVGHFEIDAHSARSEDGTALHMTDEMTIHDLGTDVMMDTDLDLNESITAEGMMLERVGSHEYRSSVTMTRGRSAITLAQQVQGEGAYETHAWHDPDSDVFCVLFKTEPDNLRTVTDIVDFEQSASTRYHQNIVTAAVRAMRERLVPGESGALPPTETRFVERYMARVERNRLSNFNWSIFLETRVGDDELVMDDLLDEAWEIPNEKEPQKIFGVQYEGKRASVHKPHRGEITVDITNGNRVVQGKVGYGTEVDSGVTIFSALASRNGIGLIKGSASGADYEVRKYFAGDQNDPLLRGAYDDGTEKLVKAVVGDL